MKGRWTGATLLGSLAIAAVAATAGPARAGVDYPPELDAAPDCTLWRGTVSGNDATVRMMFRLCPAGGDTVAGTGQWSSKVSGYNVRKLSGRWLDQGARLELHDEAVIEQHPEPGWRFCTVDRYDLARHGDELSGTYDSRACNDHATVKMSLVATEPPARPSGAPASPGPPSPSVPATVAPPSIDTKRPSPSRSCGCGVPGQPGHSGGGLVVLVALAGAGAVRRRRALRL